MNRTIPAARRAGGLSVRPVFLLLSILVIGIIGTRHLHAQNPTPGIDSLVQLAEQNHPTSVGIDRSIEAIEGRATAAGAWEAPKVGLEISMLPPMNPNPLLRGETMVMVEQEIPLFGQKQKMVDAELAMKPVEELKRESLRRELRGEVESAWFALWGIEREIALNRELRDLTEQLYRDAEARYSTNRTGQNDLYQIALEVERIDLDYRLLKSRQKEGRRLLNRTVGLPPGDTLILVDEITLPPLPPIDQLIDSLRAYPDVAQMLAMAQAQEKMATAAEGMLSPMLMLRGGVAWMPQGHPVRMDELGNMINEFHGTGETGGDHFGLMVGGMISIPIASWSRSGPEGRAAEARANAEELRARSNGMIRTMELEIEEMYGSIERLDETIRFYREKEIPLVEQQIRVVRTDYLASRVPLSSLLDLYRQLLQSKKDLRMNERQRAEMTGRLAPFMRD